MLGNQARDILAVYLFGSGARGEIEPDSDLDLLILVSDSHGAYDRLQENPTFRALDLWALDLVDGGLGPLVVTPKELVTGYETVFDSVLREGIHLFGEDLRHLTAGIPRPPQLSREELQARLKEL